MTEAALDDVWSRAAVVRRFGGLEDLDLVWRPLPSLGAGEILVETEAAGLSWADVLMLRGRYPGGPKPPFTPGWDVMGRVVRVGSPAESHFLGERVLALPLTGGAAEHVRVPVDRAVVLPRTLDALQAACLTMNYVTAWQMLRLARAEPGQSLLVHGAAGGVGSALLDLARSQSLRAFGVASPQRASAVTDMGATFIDRTRDDPFALAAEGGRLDMVFDPVGGAHVRRALAALRPQGRLVSYGFLGTRSGSPLLAAVRQMAELKLRSVGSRKARFYRLSDSARRDPSRFRSDLAALLDLLADGRIHPRVGGVMRLEDIRDAVERLAGGGVMGRLLLCPEGRAEAPRPL